MSLTFPPRRPAVPLALAAISGAAAGPLIPLALAWLLAGAALVLILRPSRGWTLLLVAAVYGTLASTPSDPLALPRGPASLTGTLVGDLESGRAVALEVGGREVPLRVMKAAGVWGRPAPGARVRVLGRAGSSGLRVAELRVLEPGKGWGALLASWRRSARRQIRQATHGRSRGLLLAVLLGERGGLPPRSREAFARTGSAHLLSISGLHTGLLLSGVLGALALAGVRPPSLRRAGLLLLVLLVGVVGARAPVLRAAVAGGIFLLLPGRGDGWNRLAVALLVVLAWDPGSLESIGFRLSFGTVAGILALAPPLVRWAGGRRRPVRAAVAGALACFLASAPLLGLTFDALPLAALPLGLPTTFLFAAILGLGSAGLALGALVPAVGGLCLRLAATLSEGLFVAIEAAAEVPGASLPLRTGSPCLAVLALGLLALGAVRREAGRSAVLPGALGAGLLLAVLAGLDR